MTSNFVYLSFSWLFFSGSTRRKKRDWSYSQSKWITRCPHDAKNRLGDVWRVDWQQTKKSKIKTISSLSRLSPSVMRVVIFVSCAFRLTRKKRDCSIKSSTCKPSKSRERSSSIPDRSSYTFWLFFKDLLFRLLFSITSTYAAVALIDRPFLLLASKVLFFAWKFVILNHNCRKSTHLWLA